MTVKANCCCCRGSWPADPPCGGGCCCGDEVCGDEDDAAIIAWVEGLKGCALTSKYENIEGLVLKGVVLKLRPMVDGPPVPPPLLPDAAFGMVPLAMPMPPAAQLGIEGGMVPLPPAPLDTPKAAYTSGAGVGLFRPPTEVVDMVDEVGTFSGAAAAEDRIVGCVENTGVALEADRGVVPVLNIEEFTVPLCRVVKRKGSAAVPPYELGPLVLFRFCCGKAGLPPMIPMPSVPLPNPTVLEGAGECVT